MPYIVPRIVMRDVNGNYRSWPDEQVPLEAGYGVYTITGQAVNLARTRRLVAETGMFSLTGQQVVSAPVLGTPSVAGATVNIAFTGSDFTTLIPQYRLVGAPSWTSLVNDITSPLTFSGLNDGSYQFRALANGVVASNVVTATVSTSVVIAPTVSGSTYNKTVDWLYAVNDDWPINHESTPYGVPSSYDWYLKGRIAQGNTVPVDFTAFTAWGQVFRTPASPSTTASIQLRNFQCYICYGSGHTWTRVQVGGITGAAFNPDFQGNVSQPADIQTSNGISTVNFAVDTAFHFWPSQGRITLPSTTEIHGILVLGEGRVNSQNASDDGDYLMGWGADYWRSLTAEWLPDYSNNKDVGISRMKLLRRQWEWFGMSTASDTDVASFFTQNAVNNIASNSIVRFGITGGSGASSWTANYRTPSGTGSYLTSPLVVGQPYFDIATSVPSGTAQMYVSATDGVNTTNSGTALATSATTNWQLAAGHYEPSKADPIIVFPRPDASSHATERHRLAPAGRRWTCPVNMYSGSWPFHYSVDAVSAAKGITVGSQLVMSGSTLIVPDDYAELAWNNPTIGSHEITVTVRTQEYGRNVAGFSTEKTVTFTLVVAAADDLTKFVWLSGTGNDTTGTGTPTNPFRNLSKVFNSTAYVGRQCHMLSGTYPTNGTGNMALNFNTPATLVADSGANVTVSLTQWPFIYSADGCYVQGFNIVEGGYGATVANSQVFKVNQGVDNNTFYRIIATNLSNGTSGGDNPTLIFSDGGVPSVAKVNFVISRCADLGRADTSNSGSLYILFAADQGVAEFNTITGNGRYSAVLKDSNRRWSVRCNDGTGLTGSVDAQMAFATGCQLQNYITQDIEISYNKSNAVFRFNYQATNSSGVHHIFRNNFTKGISGWNTSTAGVGPFNIDKNAVEGTVVTGSRVVITNSECHNSSSLDTSLNLQGTFRTNYLGIRGAEVA